MIIKDLQGIIRLGHLEQGEYKFMTERHFVILKLYIMLIGMEYRGLKVNNDGTKLLVVI